MTHRSSADTCKHICAARTPTASLLLPARAIRSHSHSRKPTREAFAALAFFPGQPSASASASGAMRTWWPSTLASPRWYAAEIAAAIKSELGEQFPVSLRFSNWKVNHYDAVLVENPTELEDFLQPLVSAGVDIFTSPRAGSGSPHFRRSTGPSRAGRGSYRDGR